MCICAYTDTHTHTHTHTHTWNIQFSRSVVSDFLPSNGLHAACQASYPSPTQTHVLWVSDAIQPSYPLSSPSLPAFSKHQGLFQWVNYSHQVAKVLEFQLQHQPYWWIFRTDFLKIDWFDLLVVLGTLRSLLQQHSSNIAPSSINFFNPTHIIFGGFLRGSAVKKIARRAGDGGSIPGLRISSGEGYGYPFQYSCLGNPLDRGA